MQEKMMILKMLEEGKIDSQQAVALLEALDPKPKSVDKVIDPEAAVREAGRESLAEERKQAREARMHAKEQANEARLRAREEAARARKAIRDSVKEGRDVSRQGSLGDSLMKTLRTFGLSTGGKEEFSFARNLSGCLEHGGEVKINNTNGTVKVVTRDGEDWELNIVNRVRANDKQTASQVAEQLVSVQSNGSDLIIEAKRLFGQSAAADIELSLPAVLLSKATLNSTNGTISAQGLQVGSIILKTVNGKVHAESLIAEEIEAGAVNGSVRIDAETSVLRCKSVNGRVQVALRSKGDAKLDLQTINGGVTAELTESQNTGYRITANSTSGGITIGVPQVEYKQNTRRSGKRSVLAESLQLADKEFVQDVVAKTVSGSINITNIQGGEN